MQDEEIIYQITRAVYRRLGPYADRALVEDLVTDVFKVVKPNLPSTPGASAPPPDHYPPPTAAAGRAVISIFGQDAPGIIAAVSQILAEFQCSVADINQTVLRGKFAMLMIADLSRMNGSIADLQAKLKEESARLGVKAFVQREDLFHAMHRI